MEDNRVKAIIGFGENKEGVPTTVYYYLDKLFNGNPEDLDKDFIYMDSIVRYAYDKRYLTYEDLEKATKRKRKVIERVVKKMEDKDLMTCVKVIGERRKVESETYIINREIYGTSNTKEMYGSDDFYRSIKRLK